MALQVTNRIVSSALRGETVKVTLDSTEALADLPLINKGDVVATVTTGYFGTVRKVDYDGNSFLVTPYMPTGNFSSSSTPGFLAVDELINIV